MKVEESEWVLSGIEIQEGLAGIEAGKRESFSPHTRSQTFIQTTEAVSILPWVLRHVTEKVYFYILSFCLISVERKCLNEFELERNLDRNEVAGCVLVELSGTSFCRDLIGGELETVGRDWWNPDTNIRTSQQWWHSPGRPWKVQTSWAVWYFYGLLQRTSR